MTTESNRILSDDDVNNIRQLFDKGNITAIQLSSIYGTSRQNINRIIDGETFKHLHVYERRVDNTNIATKDVITDEILTAIQENLNKRLGYKNNPIDSGFDCRKPTAVLANELGIKPETITYLIRKHRFLNIDEQHRIDMANFSNK
jgi:hypothetical protein